MNPCVIDLLNTHVCKIQVQIVRLGFQARRELKYAEIYNSLFYSQSSKLYAIRIKGSVLHYSRLSPSVHFPPYGYYTRKQVAHVTHFAQSIRRYLCI